jgi:hypothetical protein
MRDRDGNLTLKVDPDWLDLAHEFKRKPFGGHTPALQELLALMRSGPIEGRHFLYLAKPQHKEWTLARMSETRPLKPTLIGPTFDSIEAAEWHVFKLRWEQLTGRALPID